MATSLHSFFIYVFFGYFFIFPLIFLCLKVFDINHPKQRMSMYLMGLSAPIVGFLLYHTLLTTRCQSGIYPAGMFWQIFDIFCRVGNSAIVFLGPILTLLLVIGILKAVGGALYLTRVRASEIEPSVRQQTRVLDMVYKHCDRWQMSVPNVVFTGRNGFVAFAAGLLKPVVVVSVPLLEQLSEEEIEGILVHELIHIRRGDTITGWLLHLTRDLMFFSPFSTILLDRYMLERERLCDWEAATVLGHPRAYAATILKAWRLIVEQHEFRLGTAAGFVGKKQDMELRIHSLLEADPNGQKLPGVLFLTLLFSAATLMVLYLGYIC